MPHAHPAHREAYKLRLPLKSMFTTQCDSRARLYLRESLRERYGERFVVEERADGVLLVPLPQDPVRDLAELGRPLRNLTLQEIKDCIAEQADEVGA